MIQAFNIKYRATKIFRNINYLVSNSYHFIYSKDPQDVRIRSRGVKLLDPIVVLHWQRQAVKSFVACVEVTSGLNLQNDKLE